ncbi:MAG: hypothetical protein ACTSQF_01875 [Candidatus Heimdallarchaeaceae archaeon]
MDIATMHIGFKLEVDKGAPASLQLPAFEPEEIDYWLNRSIRKIVKTRTKEFEKNQKRIDDLKELIVEVELTPTVGTVKPNSFIADISGLTDPLWFTLGEEVDIEYIKLGDISTTTERQGVTEATVNNYRAKIDDPYSEHHLHYENAKPIRLVYQETVELITDGDYDVTSYYLRYLRKPVEVSLSGTIDCDLSEHIHDEIVIMAASIALENIEQPRYQTHMNEVSTME